MRFRWFFIIMALLPSLIIWGQTQADCGGIRDITAQTDMLLVERQLPGCDSQAQAMLDEVLTALDGDLDALTRARYHIFAGLLYAKTGNIFEATTILQNDAILSAREAQSKPLEALASYYAGIVFFESGQLDRAMQWFNQAYSIAEAANDNFTRGRVTLIRGQEALRKEQNREALVLLQEALPLLMSVPTISVPEQIENLEALANIQRIYEQFPQATLLISQRNALRNNPDLYADLQSGGEVGSCTLQDIENAVDFLAVERALAACVAEAPALQERIQTARQNTNDNATIGRLQMLSGLVYEAQRDYYQAVRSYEQALGTLRSLGDKQNEALDVLYLGRSYMARQQYDGGLQFIRMAQANGDVFTVGRAELALGRYTLNNLQNFGEAVRLLTSALPKLQTLGDNSHPEQLETLYLLNRAYAGLGDANRAAQYDQLYRDLRGGSDPQLAAVEASGVCPFRSLAFQYDVILVERLRAVCQSEFGGLSLTAQAAYYTSSDDRVKGVMQIYLGFALVQVNDSLNAPLAFDRAIVHLQKIGDQQLLALAHYYLALAYYDNQEDGLGASNLQTARNAAARVNDNFTMGRVDWQFAEIELEKRNYRGAIALYQQAFDLLAVSPISAIPEQRDIAQGMIFIYSDEVDIDDEEQRWREIQSSLNDQPTTARPTAVPTTVAEGENDNGETPEDGGSTTETCDPKALVRLESLVEVEKSLAFCASLGPVLLEGQTALSQAQTDQDKAYYENFVGVVQQTQGQYYDAFLSHGRAVNLYRTLADNTALAQTYYYYGRAIYGRSAGNEGLNFLRESEKLATQQGDSYTVAAVNLWFADLTAGSGDLDTTMQYLEKARTNFETSNATVEATGVILRLARIYDQRSLFDTALDYYTQIMTNAEITGVDAHFVEASMGFARHYKYFGQYERAQQYIDAALEKVTDPVARGLASGELASIATKQEDYEKALRILNGIDEKQFDCAVADQLRVYRGDYLVAVGQASQATAVYRQVIGNECDTRLPTTLADAYAGVADAELERGSSNVIIQNAINASRAESARLNYPDPDYPRGDQRSRLQEAEYFRRLRDFERVLVLVGDVRTSAERYNDLRGQVDVAMLLVTMRIEQGQFQNALDLLATASDIYKRMDFTIGLSKTVEQQVRIYIDQARYPDAIRFIEFARSEYSVLPISFDSRITFYEGILFEKRGRTEEALVLYTVARDGFEQSGEILSILDVDLQRVGLLHRRSSFNEARQLILDARSTAESLENTYYIAQAELMLGDNYVLSYLQSPESATLDQAEPPYSRALESYALVGNIAGEAQVNIRLGELELLLIQQNASTRQATRYLNRSLELYRILNNSFGEVDAMRNLATYYLLTGKYNDAIEFANNALRILGDNEPFLRADLYTTLGLAYEYNAKLNGNNRADLLQAIQYYDQATQLISFVYAEIADIDAQRLYAVQERSLLPYNRLIRIYALTYYIESPEADAEKAFYYAEQSRARSYLTQLQGEDINFGEDNDALQEWQTLRKDTINLNRTLKDVRQRAGDDAETENIETQIEANITRMQELETQIDLPLLQLLTIDVSTIPDIQASLPEDTTMIIYYVIPGQQTPVELEASRIMAFVLKPSGNIALTPIRVDDYDQNIVNQISGILRNRLPPTPGRPMQTPSERLYMTLVEPIRSSLNGYDNLIIVPHAILNYVPFEMLWDDDWLVQDFTITYAPSATVFSLLENSISGMERGSKLLALGYSGAGYEGKGLNPLTYYDNEVNRIARIYPNTEVLLDDAANETALNQLDDLDVIHFAAHGVFNNRSPLLSYVALSPEASGSTDGQLEVREIYNLSLNNTHPLIVLSACDLARARIQRGDEVEGMTRAFLLTGARGVIASFWPVDDLSTTQFMELFYGFRKEGLSEAAALTAAKRAMIADPAYSDANNWAGFVLVGIPE